MGFGVRGSEFSGLDACHLLWQSPCNALYMLLYYQDPLAEGQGQLLQETDLFFRDPQYDLFIWVVVKIMVPFWVLIIIQHLIFRVPKGDHYIDNHPYVLQEVGISGFRSTLNTNRPQCYGYSRTPPLNQRRTM